jgi:hypothetical protein
LHDAVTPAMRDNLNFNMLPIVQDNMNCVPGALTNLSSNGYYGYQAPLDKRKNEPLEPHACYMEVQCETASHRGSRKRAWELADDFREFKKRRQNGESCLFLESRRVRTGLPWGPTIVEFARTIFDLSASILRLSLVCSAVRTSVGCSTVQKRDQHRWLPSRRLTLQEVGSILIRQLHFRI